MGLGAPGTGDPSWPGVAEAEADADGEAERVGLGLCDGVRVGLDGVGVGVVLGLTAGPTTPAGAGTGRTRKYRASTARNSTVSTMVEVRGRLAAGRRVLRLEPLMTRLR
ncbi:MAG: hypothetical protein ACRDOB_26690 [Streptosporangiaceae bacterium]